MEEIASSRDRARRAHARSTAFPHLTRPTLFVFANSDPWIGAPTREAFARGPSQRARLFAWSPGGRRPALQSGVAGDRRGVLDHRPSGAPESAKLADGVVDVARIGLGVSKLRVERPRFDDDVRAGPRAGAGVRLVQPPREGLEATVVTIPRPYPALFNERPIQKSFAPCRTVSVPIS